MPDLWMDVDVALSEVPVNIMPLLDDTDFKTRETAIAYNAAGMDLVWNFTTSAGAFTQTAVTPTTAGVHDWTHQGDGMYTIEMPASAGTINNDTEGIGWFTGFVTGVLPWRGPTIGFRAATINDALLDSDTLLTAQDVRLLYEGAVSTVNSQTSFDMDTAIITDDNWNDLTCTIFDISTGDSCVRYITDVDQANNRIIINAVAPFAVVVGDKFRVFASMHPTPALNNYDPPTRSELTTDTNQILDRIIAIAQLLGRKDAAIATDRSAELSLINTDEGSGAGAYANTTDSLEARADTVDDANLVSVAGGNNLTAAGSGGQKYGES